MSSVSPALEEVLNRTGQQTAKFILEYPVPPAPRTLVLDPAVEPGPNIRVASVYDEAMVAAMQPEAIAAPVEDLMNLARSVKFGAVAPPLITHSVIAFTGIRSAPLTDAGRELLWRVFQVPAFEQLRGLDGQLLAYECEAHDGLHFHPEDAVVETAENNGLMLTSLNELRHPTLRMLTNSPGELLSGRCGCGSTEPRFRRLDAARPNARAASSGR